MQNEMLWTEKTFFGIIPLNGCEGDSGLISSFATSELDGSWIFISNTGLYTSSLMLHV